MPAIVSLTTTLRQGDNLLSIVAIGVGKYAIGVAGFDEQLRLQAVTMRLAAGGAAER
jgi:hypothetical protein